MARRSRGHPDSLEGLRGDAKILQEARDRFDIGVEYFSEARQRFLSDRKFFYADPDNHYQWADDIAIQRGLGNKPTLTINQTRQFGLNIINEGDQRRMSIDVRPVGDMASYAGAMKMEGIVQYIQVRSQSEAIFDECRTNQISSGFAFFRVLSEYADDSSFDQDLVIARIPDPLSVIMDPGARKPDRSDMGWCFIYDDVARDEFLVKYPQYAGIVGSQNMVGTIENWQDKNQVRVCEYYRRKLRKAKLYGLYNEGTGKYETFRDDIQPPEIIEAVKNDPNVKTRDIVAWDVEWFKIVGGEIVDRRTRERNNLWLGSTIPVFYMPGEEVVIDKRYDCKSHTRYLKDAQRMYNYWTSAATEQVALQGKNPFMAPARAIEGYTNEWANANVENLSVLPWNDVDEEGNAIQKPERVEPPVMSQAYVAGMQISANELRMTAGQYEEDLGARGQAISGVAMESRIRQSNIATQHFASHEAMALEACGRCLIELIPKIYDSKRVLRLLSEDGTETELVIDPDLKAEIQKEELQDQMATREIFNPGFAKYSVRADVGPTYASMRQHAFDAITGLMKFNPEISSVAGDILMKAADFPLADELAQRLRRMVPPQALGDGPSPQEAALQAQVQKLETALQKLFTDYERLKVKSDSDGQSHLVDLYRTTTDRHIQEFRAITDRLKIFTDGLQPGELERVVRETVNEALTNRLPELTLPAEGIPGTGAIPQQ